MGCQQRLRNGNPVLSDDRQPGYDAVYASGLTPSAYTNAKIWRSVQAYADAMDPVIAERVRVAQEQAWDEGAGAAIRDTFDVSGSAVVTNPYRKKTD